MARVLLQSLATLVLLWLVYLYMVITGHAQQPEGAMSQLPLPATIRMSGDEPVCAPPGQVLAEGEVQRHNDDRYFSVGGLTLMTPGEGRAQMGLAGALMYGGKRYEIVLRPVIEKGQ